MLRRRGRTGRNRLGREKREKRDPRGDDDGIDGGRIIQLMQWLKTNGFSEGRKALKVHEFPYSGRGLMALKNFKSGEFLVSIPENLLITTTTVLESDLGPFVQCFSETTPLSPVEAICGFLISERHKGRQSRWFPYIDVLPTSYSIPAYWTIEERLSLPKSVYLEAEEQSNVLSLSFQKLSNFFRIVESSLPATRGALTYERFCWAWASVNTRGVYWEGPCHPELNGSPNRCALVPFLDFFNHSSNAKIEAKFDGRDRSYKLRTLTKISRYSEAFINYGPHDSVKLVLEYGFAVPRNPNDAVKFTIDDLVSACKVHRLDSNLDVKMAFLNKFNLSGGLSCSAEGVSWNLQTAARILASSSIEKDQLLNVYRDEEVDTSGQNQRHIQLMKALLVFAISTIPNIPCMTTEITFHQKLAFDLCLNHRNLLEQCLSDLNVQSDIA